MLGVIIIILGAFLAGYVLGKHYGRQTGYEEGQSSMPLQLRQESLEQGFCVLCQAPQNICQEANKEAQ